MHKDSHVTREAGAHTRPAANEKPKKQKYAATNLPLVRRTHAHDATVWQGGGCIYSRADLVLMAAAL